MTSPLKVLTDEGIVETISRGGAPIRTGATKALHELFDADWPNLPGVGDAMKVLADLGIQCSTATFYIVRKKYVADRNGQKPAVDSKSNRAAVGVHPGSIEMLIRVCGWIEVAGGIDKLREWLLFVEDFQGRLPTTSEASR